MRAVAYAAFFLSGASSLIFQSIWTRLLHHVFGATSVAMSSVLTAFMAGLGLGAHLFGTRAGRTRRPLRAYALCELGVAAWALGLPWLLRADGPLASLNLLLREQLGAHSTLFPVARFLCVLPVLIVPTTLMGATLPFLVQHFVRAEASSQKASARTGTLYAVNTLGAVLGTGMASFVLMPLFGVRATNLSAVGLNALLGLGLLVLDRSSAAPFAQSASASPMLAAGASSSPLPDWARQLAVGCFAVSGACAMTYEVVWSRALSMAIGSSLQAFALILVTFLVGIAAGSAVIAHALAAVRVDALALLSASALSLLALSPSLALEDAALTLVVWVLIVGVLVIGMRLEALKARQTALLSDDVAGSPALGEDAARLVLLVPPALALLEAARFASKRSSLSAPALHGYLPFISATVVLTLSAFVWVALRFRRSPWLLACAMQLGIALATLASYAFQDEIPYTFARLVTSLDNLPQRVGTVRFFMFFAAGMCTLPATLGMGAMFPVTLALWSRDGAERRQDAGRDVGTVYAANTLGSILGSWLPGFVLLPRLGMELTLRAGVMLNTCVALAMLAGATRLFATERAQVRRLAAVAGALIAGLLWLSVSQSKLLSWNLSHMTLGAFRMSLAEDVLDPTTWGEPDLLYYRDGLSTTVSVERWGAHVSLKNNGKVDASNGDDMPTQIMVAAYPLLMHARGPKDLDVAVVGFGSGVTVGAALAFPVRHVDAVELEERVVEAASRFFADVNHLPRKSGQFPYVSAPRLTLHEDDGRNFLAATRKQYDVIISEPSNPWITGVSDLFTADHFRMAKQRLKPGGVYCQWVQLYEMSPENIKTIYRTFAAQFRYALAFAAEELSSDTILIGSDSPIPFDLRHTAKVMNEPRVKTELARAFVDDAHGVWSRTLFATRAEILQFAQLESRRVNGKWLPVDRSTGREPCPSDSCRRTPAQLNTDDNMRIELGAPSDLIGYERYAGYWRLFYGESWPYGELSQRLLGLDTVQARAAFALSLLAHGRTEQARVLVRTLAEGEPQAAVSVRTARLLLDLEPGPAPEFGPPRPGPPLTAAVRNALDNRYREGLRALARGDSDAALGALERISGALRTQSGPDIRFTYACALFAAATPTNGLAKEAADELETLLRDEPEYARSHPAAYFHLARALMAASRFDRAVRNMRSYAEFSVKH